MRQAPLVNKDSRQSLRVMVIGRFTAIHAVRFVEELQRQGVDVAALWIGPGKSSPKVRVYHAEGDMRVLGIRRTATLGCLLYIHRAIRDFRPNVIHVQDDHRIPHWLDFICPSNVLRAYTNWGHNPGITKLSSFRKGLANTHLLTSDAADVLAEIAGFAPNAHKEIIRFGADTELFSEGEADNTVLAQYGLDPKGLYILSPRSLRPNYNQITLIRALPPVIERFSHLKVIVKHNHVGNFKDTRDYEYLIRKEAKQLGIWDRIIRLDHLPPSHLCQLYRLSRVAVSIPLEDGFPASIFEAMACGCALIVSNDQSYDGVVVDGRNAITISPEDTSALSESLIRMLGDSRLANVIRKEGMKTVAEKGNFKTEISRLIQTYHSLIAMHTARKPLGTVWRLSSS